MSSGYDDSLAAVGDFTTGEAKIGTNAGVGLSGGEGVGIEQSVGFAEHRAVAGTGVVLRDWR